MTDKCVVRNQAYRRGGLNKRERHNERKNADYMNGDIIPERSAFKVHYKRCESGYEQARQRAPRLMADVIADIMRKPPEQVHQRPDRAVARNKGPEL